MRRGRQAADDGSFARSVGVHTARGAVLIGVALLLGVILLQKVDSGNGPATQVDSGTATTGVVTTLPPSTTSTRPASRVTVLVANGTTTNGVGLNAKNVIGQAGYNALAPVDATAAAKQAKRITTVYFNPGYDTDARKIAALLSITPTPPVAAMPAVGAGLPVSDLKTANVLVVVGPDYPTTGTAGTSAATVTTRKGL
ncbi:MAG TPA: LytR C-terminal domain-containing protein [Acidimicrobiales bacterium]|nr:LytR C-terminal domain-containing protein [Acidimicrobiales bacterium]